MLAGLLLAVCALPAAAVPPGQPTGLTVVTLGVNSFRLTWNDNSTDESFFGVQARVPPSLDWISLDEVDDRSRTATQLRHDAEPLDHLPDLELGLLGCHRRGSHPSVRCFRPALRFDTPTVG